MSVNPTESSTMLEAVCTQKQLSEAVQLVAHAVSDKTPLDILKHVLVQSHEEGLVISGSDLELGISMIIPADVRRAGALTAPARLLSDLVSSLPDGEITLSCDRSHAVHVHIPGSDYRILGLPPEEYPTMPAVDDAVTFTIGEKLLKEACRQTLFAVLTESRGRPMLSGVLIDFEEDTAAFVSTDTVRLALRRLPVQNGKGTARAIVPHRTMNELARALSDTGDVVVTISEKHIQFATSREVTVTSRLIEGQYPAYQRVIPTTYRTRLTFHKEPLLQAVRRADIFGRTAGNRVEFQTVQDKVVLQAESSTEGKAIEEVEVIREGDDIHTAFNARHILDALGAMDSEGVVMDLTDPTKAVVLRPSEKDEAEKVGEYLCVLMPLQLF